MVRAVALTLRGHGDADGAPSHTLADVTGDVAAVLDALCIDTAVVVGHSMGSIVTERVAIDHADRVAPARAAIPPAAARARARSAR
ncbi:MAG TPA: alpha/beta fold hydrolase [Solirubrobacteraceae bacterium]|nr:alpha/beta fold hydrolase [Solirubrobacteraceae bacterium]